MRILRAIGRLFLRLICLLKFHAWNEVERPGSRGRVAYYECDVCKKRLTVIIGHEPVAVDSEWYTTGQVHNRDASIVRLIKGRAR